MQVSFTVNTKELKKALHKIYTLQKRSKTAQLKIVVYDEEVKIEVQRVTQIIKGKTEGMGDVLLPSKLFDSYVQTSSSTLISFTFTNGRLQCGTSVFDSSAIEVLPSAVEPQNEVPLNLSPVSLLRFAANKSAEEIKALGLTGSYQYAKTKLKQKITEAVAALEDYNITYDDIKELVDKKLKS